jgi:hypothetical protein
MKGELSGFCAPGWWTPERNAAMWPAERRQRQREQARRLHAKGRLGGAENGRKGAAARQRKVDEEARLVHEAVAALGRQKANEIVAKLDDMLRSDSPRVQLAAIGQIFAAEAWVARHGLDADDDLAAMSEDELDAELATVLSDFLGIDFCGVGGACAPRSMDGRQRPGWADPAARG